MGQKALAPIVFARSPDAGFKVPHSWVGERGGNCVVEIDVSGDSVSETATFAAVLKRAFDLAVECVIKPPHLGGRSLVGEREGLEIAMYGR